MLENISKLGGLFAQNRSDHPLANPNELHRILAEIPMDNAFKALDEIVGWLESVVAVEDITEEVLFDVVRQLDEAAQWHELRLGREYLHSRRLSKTDEKRLWSIVHGFWSLTATCYEKCITRLAQKDKVAEALRPQLPLLASRLIKSLGAALKWERFRYGPQVDTVWLRLGLAYAAAEQAGVAGKPVQLYPKVAGMTTPQQEYLKILALHTSSIDSLLPAEIELAERLVGNFVSGFVFGPASSAESVYWVDIAHAQAPLRLAKVPRQMVSSLRFFNPGKAYDNLMQLVGDLERGGALPSDLNLGNQYHPRAVLPVLRHLATYWAPLPPQRRHKRHPVKHRMSVLVGLPNAVAAFSGQAGSQATGLQMESWVVENVSHGGFGMVIGDAQDEWLKVGTLVTMQPEGGDNWLLGVVRRFRRDSDKVAHVGILTLARQLRAVELKPRTASSYAAAAGVPGLWLQDAGEEGEVCLVLPLNTFDLRAPMEFADDGRMHVLAPGSLAEQAADYEIARYRLQD